MIEAKESLTWRNDRGRWWLAGRIDEHADLRRLARELPESGAVIDLADVKRINSIGTREWIEFVQLVRDRPIVLERCPPTFVDQLNAIANFRGHAEVRSVLASFECMSCGTQLSVDVVLKRAFPTGDTRHFIGPACEQCGRPMELDDDPEHFFQFVRSTSRR
jgi:hypothetical protein